jgi:hypothetical protein
LIGIGYDVLVKDKVVSLAKAEDAIAKLKDMRLGQAAEKAREGVAGDAAYIA